MNCPKCGLMNTGNLAVGLAMPQCMCHWQSPAPPRQPLTTEEHSVLQQSIKDTAELLHNGIKVEQMNNIETMKLTDPHDHPEPHTMKWTQLEMDYINKRVETAVRQAIEQAQQAEPVAWLNPYGGVVQKRMDGHERTHYTIPLYTTPTKRKPLTRKEVLAIIDKHPAEKKNLLPMFYRDQVLDICRDIEQAYGIKEEI